MQDDDPGGSIAALRRKLRGVAAIADDPGATPAERANAAAVKKRLEQQLRAAGVPSGDWSDTVFRLGRRLGGLRKGAAAEASGADWTEQARTLGKAVRRGYKKWLSE